MPTNVFGQPARDMAEQQVGYFRKRITFEDAGGPVDVGILAPGAIVVGGGVFVETPFNDGTTDLVDVGFEADGDALATDLDVSTAGFKPLDELGAATNTVSASSRKITAQYAGGTGDASAGVAHVIVEFVLNNDK